jgi:hypothetical protein
MLLTLLAAWTVLSLATVAALGRLARMNVALDDLVMVFSAPSDPQVQRDLRFQAVVVGSDSRASAPSRRSRVPSPSTGSHPTRGRGLGNQVALVKRPFSMM